MEFEFEAEVFEWRGPAPFYFAATPDEVSHAVLFLCSPLSGFVTGEIIDMNGGFQMD